MPTVGTMTYPYKPSSWRSPGKKGVGLSALLLPPTLIKGGKEKNKVSPMLEMVLNMITFNMEISFDKVVLFSFFVL